MSVRVLHFCFSPGGQTFPTHGGGGQTFFTHRGGGKHFYILGGGGQTFFVGGGGGYDFVDEEIDVSETSFLVSEANCFASEACKLSAGARIFRGPEILVVYNSTYSGKIKLFLRFCV